MTIDRDKLREALKDIESDLYDKTEPLTKDIVLLMQASRAYLEQADILAALPVWHCNTCKTDFQSRDP